MSKINLENIMNNYYLRLVSGEFLLLVHKENNEYTILYRRSTSLSREEFKSLSEQLDKHPKLEI